MAAAAAAWDVPAIESAGALADWLLLDHGELAWFADFKGLGYKRNRPRLRHYRYQVRTKRSGSIRLIEAPKMRLKKLQRQILAGILAGIPPHSAAQGFLRGRSIKTFVAPHVGQRVVLRMDLQNFFPSIAGSRIQALFRTMGYPETVADLRGGICTNATPPDIWKDAVEGGRVGHPCRAIAGGAGPVFAAAFTPGRTELAGACQPLRLLGGLPVGGAGEVGWRPVHALRRRSGVFRRRSIREMRGAVSNARRRHSARREFQRAPPQDAHHARRLRSSQGHYSPIEIGRASCRERV